MIYDNKFMDFCESEENRNELYNYKRFITFLPVYNNVFFDTLYNEYCKKYGIEKVEFHYKSCAFHAFEYFLDYYVKEFEGEWDIKTALLA